jgi:predicted molibdopterin-dependent oxidoreductase YjgC
MNTVDKMIQLKKYDLKRVHLTIDGQAMLGRVGQTILEVARENRIRIPTLCYLEKLKPLGSCRMCVVEVDGTPMPVTACTTPIAEGMVVRTNTPYLENLRRETLKLILLRHPLNCAACEVNGDCELQDLVHQYDISHSDLHTYDIRPIEFTDAEYATPLIKYHPRRCILCGRCVHACVEIAGVGAIEFQGRGATARIAPVQTDKWAPPGVEGVSRPSCVSCGECMAVCPANALTEALGQPKGKAWETSKVKTVCTYCGCGCELELNVVNDRVVGVTPSEGGVNKGMLCTKGRFGYDFINHRDRLKEPLIRRNGYWQETNWDEALDYIAERLVDIRLKHGADSIGGLSSARCTNEENYLFQKFMRGVIGTNNVDHCARL